MYDDIMLVLRLNELGAIIRRLRTEQGMTQIDLAKKAGVSRAWLIRIERGEIDSPQMGEVMQTLSSLGYAFAIEPKPKPSSLLGDIVDGHRR